MPNPDELRADLNLALRAVERAAALALAFFGCAVPVRFKSPDQPVTEADLQIDRLLRDILLGERPGYGWLSEETEDSADRLTRSRVWVVDPIDGTRAFVEGRPEYAISVALAVDGAATLGVLLNPSTGELFHAQREAGARRNGALLRPAWSGDTTVLVSRSEAAAGELEGLPPDWSVVTLGSTAYKMVKTLDGTGDVYLSRRRKDEWDVCAAALIVAEAGGTVTDLRGRSLEFNRAATEVHGIVAGAPGPHRRLVREGRWGPAD